MKKIAFCALVLYVFQSVPAFAQNIGINTTGSAANALNMLEVLQISTTANSVGIYANSSGNIAGTGYGLKAITSGASTTNVAGYFNATGATNNYAGIFENGFVGIGTTSPLNALHVSSAAAWIARFSSSAAANGGIYVNAATGFNANIGLQQNGTDKWYLGNRASNDRFSIIESTGATEIFTILQGGNVGIGTIVPGSKLSVVGTSATSTVHSSFGSTQWRMKLNAGDEANSGTIDYRGFDGTALGIVGAGTGANRLIRMWEYLGINTAPSIAQALNVSGTGATYAAVFQNGNVGIGTATPGAALEVAGQVKITGGTPGLNKVLTSDASGLASWSSTAGGEWTDAGAFLYPADGDAEKVSIGKSTGTTLAGTDSKLLVYGESGYGYSRAIETVYNDQLCSLGANYILDLQFGNAVTVGSDDKYIRFLKGLGTEVGSITDEVVYNTFTGGHVGQSAEDGSAWRPGMIVSACGGANNPTMGRAWVKIGLSKTPKDPAAIGVYTTTEFPHRLADLDTTRPAYYYNALGEGLILVTDDGGDIKIGDYITTSSRPGYGMKQDDDFLHNYTVAKATDSVKWSEVAIDRKYEFKWKLISCTYHGG